jgi:uncharacterized protein
MPRILESVVVTKAVEGGWHMVPFGLIQEDEDFVVAPFRPSPSIAHLQHHPYLSAAAPADIRVLAGCVTGRRDWSIVPCEHIDGMRLAEAYSHAELEVVGFADDPVRPRFRCRILHVASHRAFLGYNRAQAAVLEAAILSTRLHMLPAEKIISEMEYLRTAISKTAGPTEQEAWNWIEEKISAALKAGGADDLGA